MPVPSRVRLGVALAAAALALTACASSSTDAPTNWKPKPSFSGEGYVPPQQQPQQQQPSAPGSSGSGTPNPSSSSSAPKKKTDPAVVAKKLKTPIGITILPDGTALVGERTTGRIVRVQPRAGKPVTTVRTVPGLSTVGGGGLLDLAISPNYSEDNLIFAYVTTPTDNRVITFTLKGAITPVLTGIPRGKADNAGRIAFAADGSLLIATGDAGRPALATNPKSLAGKILRVTDVGKPVGDNPAKGSPVYASGFTNVAGLCTSGTQTLVVEDLPGEPADAVYQIEPGATYGVAAGSEEPIKALPETSRSPGGCAIGQNALYVTSLDGKALLTSTAKAGAKGALTLGAFTASLRNKYGRLFNVIAAPDGALWMTTSNRTGNGKPIADDERVLRIVPSGGGGGESKL